MPTRVSAITIVIRKTHDNSMLGTLPGPSRRVLESAPTYSSVATARRTARTLRYGCVSIDDPDRSRIGHLAEALKQLIGRPNTPGRTQAQRHPDPGPLVFEPDRTTTLPKRL